jgi:hypothetical protein
VFKPSLRRRGPALHKPRAQALGLSVSWTSSQRWTRCPQVAESRSRRPRRRFTDDFTHQAVSVWRARTYSDSAKQASDVDEDYRAGKRQGLVSV